MKIEHISLWTGIDETGFACLLYRKLKKLASNIE